MRKISMWKPSTRGNSTLWVVERSFAQETIFRSLGITPPTKSFYEILKIFKAHYQSLHRQKSFQSSLHEYDVPSPDSLSPTEPAPSVLQSLPSGLVGRS